MAFWWYILQLAISFLNFRNKLEDAYLDINVVMPNAKMNTFKIVLG